MPLGAVDAITLFVEVLPRAASFYEAVFGQPLIFEDEHSAAFRFDHLVVNLLEAPAAHDLIAPAPVAGPDAGARIQLTIGVDDVDAACARLGEHGVTLLNGPMDREWGVRTASFIDPGGHIWEVAQDRADS